MADVATLVTGTTRQQHLDFWQNSYSGKSALLFAVSVYIDDKEK